MTGEPTPQTLSPSPKMPGNTTDRDDSLQVEMWVLGEHGKSLGTLDTLQRDPATGHVSTFVVRRASWYREPAQAGSRELGNRYHPAFGADPDRQGGLQIAPSDERRRTHY